MNTGFRRAMAWISGIGKTKQRDGSIVAPNMLPIAPKVGAAFHGKHRAARVKTWDAQHDHAGWVKRKRKRKIAAASRRYNRQHS